MPARGSGLTTGMLERQLVVVQDQLRNAQRELKTALEGAVQVPIVTPGQLAEVRAIAKQLQQDVLAAQSLADSVANWANQLERFTPTTGHAPEVTPTT
jgi:NADH pyrophosphatase NudC (nudix superfamily)